MIWMQGCLYEFKFYQSRISVLAVLLQSTVDILLLPPFEFLRVGKVKLSENPKLQLFQLLFDRTPLVQQHLPVVPKDALDSILIPLY